MVLELKELINSIKEKTGIDICVFSYSSGKSYATSPVLTVDFPAQEFVGVYSDEEKGKTFFSFSYRQATLYGYIIGTGDTAKNYAYFIVSILESSLGKESMLSENDYLKLILSGECSSVQITKFMKKYSVPQEPCFVIVTHGNAHRADQIVNVLKTFAEENDKAVVMDDGVCALVKFIDGNSFDEYQSPTDYAEVLLQSVYDETGFKLKASIGAVVDNLEQVDKSFRQAISAYETSVFLNSRGDVHTYKEYLPLKMLEDIPKVKLAEYLDILLGKNASEIFGDEEMVSTAEEFLENSLNVSETSRNLFLHRNTLMYRLDKIEKETGLNIRKFSDALTFRIITFLFRTLK